MAIERLPGGSIVFVGNSVKLFQLMALRSALQLECKGLKRRGRSAYSIAKEVTGVKGNKEKVLAAMTKLVEEEKAKQIVIHTDEEGKVTGVEGPNRGGSE